MRINVAQSPVIQPPATPDVSLSDWFAMPGVRDVMKAAWVHRMSLPPLTPEQAAHLTGIASEQP